MASRGDKIIAAAEELRVSAGSLRFCSPVAYVYNPLEYAWAAHHAYLRRYAGGRKRVIFLGMNPGPFGMVQTGVPFGEVTAVREWLGIEAKIGRPAREHPKRPVSGFGCQRSEVSGERLWGLFSRRFGSAADFFQEHFVTNYCPLAFLEESGRNRTPDKLLPSERGALFAVCDAHLRNLVQVFEPEWLIGVGDFAEKRLRSSFAAADIRIGKILHPSPACPASNVDWAGRVTDQLKSLEVWT